MSSNWPTYDCHQFCCTRNRSFFISSMNALWRGTFLLSLTAEQIKHKVLKVCSSSGLRVAVGSRNTLHNKIR